jgi:hypothetical protein
VRQQEVKRRRIKLQQGLIGRLGTVAHVDGAQDAAVHIAVLGRTEQVEPSRDVIEAAEAARVAAMARGSFGVAV